MKNCSSDLTKSAKINRKFKSRLWDQNSFTWR